eukprot:evm.model.scf_521.6 EVM.evm.TU.scf_521.6   scf_521:45266-46195(-)
MDAASMERAVRHAVWKKNFQMLAKDLRTFLFQLWDHQAGELPPPARETLHRVVRYLIQNRCWETTSFLLKANLEHGVEIGVCGVRLTERDMQPDDLQAMAERFLTVFGAEHPPQP